MELATFSRRELYDLVWRESLLSLSRKYDISDVGLRKACLRMNIPLPKAGHWEKVKSGKKVAVTPLPTKATGDSVFRLRVRTESVDSFKSTFRGNSLQKDIEAKLSSELIVPESLENPDPLIEAVKREFEKIRPGRDSKYKEIARVSKPVLDIKVTAEYIPRALIFMDKLVKLIKIRGHVISVRESGTYFIINGQEFKIVFREKLKKIIVNNGHWNSTEYYPGGELCFQMEGWGKREWKDGKRKLEEQLSAIMAKMEATAEESKQWKDRLQRESEAREMEQKKREELEKMREKELLDFKSLLQGFHRWDVAERIRTYLNAVEDRIKRNGLTSQKQETWLSWARKKADWYDPLVEAEDEIFKDIDRDTLAIRKKYDLF